MKEIVISSQEECDALPADYEGLIIVKGNASIDVRGSSTVIAYDSSTVRACDSSTVIACDSSTVRACDSSTVTACDSSTVTAYDSSTVIAYDSSTVIAYGSSTVIAYDSSTVTACDSSTVIAYDSSTVTAYDSSTVIAYSYSQVVDCDDCDITLSGCARRVTLPANIQEYSDWYGIPIVDGKIKLYKAVRKHETGVYHSDYDPEFLYSVGKEYEQDCDTNRNEQCARGLHVAYLDWAVNYCCDWMNAAILEVEVPIECIVVPRNTDGKIRTSKLKVLREVPREEWRSNVR
jgi:hypothetical protein